MYVVICVIRQAGERQQGEGGGDEEPGHQAGPEYTGEGHSTQVIKMYNTNIHRHTNLQPPVYTHTRCEYKQMRICE